MRTRSQRGFYYSPVQEEAGDFTASTKNVQTDVDKGTTRVGVDVRQNDNRSWKKLEKKKKSAFMRNFAFIMKLARKHGFVSNINVTFQLKDLTMIYTLECKPLTRAQWATRLINRD